MTEILTHMACDISYSKIDQLVDLRYLSGTLELVLASVRGDDITKNRVVFDWVHSFRVANEGDLLKMQNDLNGQMITGIYTVEGSNYLAWFNEQSANIHVGDKITHYLIVTGDDVIDVLSSICPTISSC